MVCFPSSSSDSLLHFWINTTFTSLFWTKRILDLSLLLIISMCQNFNLSRPTPYFNIQQKIRVVIKYSTGNWIYPESFRCLNKAWYNLKPTSLNVLFIVRSRMVIPWATFFKFLVRTCKVMLSLPAIYLFLHNLRENVELIKFYCFKICNWYICMYMVSQRERWLYVYGVLAKI